MVNIKVREGESIEEAIRRFKRECEKNGIMQEIKKREFYKPPSIIKKEKLAEIKRKIRRKMLKESRWYK
ncbi:MAG: 30S ribosomal protein S21 [Endomicrobium sp.]|jgi:small subunit ribosomal protein S21|nr:30S ribosomal protein S21 [Endomicrobium sp.]